MSNQPSLINIAKGLLAVQRKMEAVTKDASNSYYKSKYADINSFLEVAIPALNEQNIALLQPTFSNAEGHWVQTILIHESGETLTYSPIRLVLKSEDMQQLGSAITYARRYSLQALLGMRAEDDDANAASGKVKPAAKATEAVTASNAAAAPAASPAAAAEQAPAAKPRTTFRKSSPPAEQPAAASNGSGNLNF